MPCAFQRIFGTAPGVYGAGVEDLIGHDADNEALGAAYLAAASHVYGGADGDAAAAPGAFAQRVANADALVHVSDDPARDLLEGAEDAAFVGGFAAAAKLLGRSVDLVMLDMTDPQRPRARALSAALARSCARERSIRASSRDRCATVRAARRSLPKPSTASLPSPKLLAQLPATCLIYCMTLMSPIPRCATFCSGKILRAAAAIAERLDAARRRGLWHPHRNDIATGFAALQAEGVA